MTLATKYEAAYFRCFIDGILRSGRRYRAPTRGIGILPEWQIGTKNIQVDIPTCGKALKPMA